MTNSGGFVRGTDKYNQYNKGYLAVHKPQGIMLLHNNTFILCDKRPETATSLQKNCKQGMYNVRY